MHRDAAEAFYQTLTDTTKEIAGIPSYGEEDLNQMGDGATSSVKVSGLAGLKDDFGLAFLSDDRAACPFPDKNARVLRTQPLRLGNCRFLTVRKRRFRSRNGLLPVVQVEADKENAGERSWHASSPADHEDCLGRDNIPVHIVIVAMPISFRKQNDADASLFRAFRPSTPQYWFWSVPRTSASSDLRNGFVSRGSFGSIPLSSA